MQTLFVAAVREELADLEGIALGVGPLASAVTMAEALAQRRPGRVVLVGSAGRYASGPPIGAAAVATRVGWGDGAAALGLAYVPRPPEPLNFADEAQFTVRVLTVPAITRDAELARRLGTDWDLEHLEAYGAALACVRAGVRFTAVLGVANDVGPDAHEQWLANRHRAEDAARRLARSISLR